MKYRLIQLQIPKSVEINTAAAATRLTGWIRARGASGGGWKVSVGGGESIGAGPIGKSEGGAMSDG